jgi:hypothetical protein
MFVSQYSNLMCFRLADSALACWCGGRGMLSTGTGGKEVDPMITQRNEG